AGIWVATMAVTSTAATAASAAGSAAEAAGSAADEPGARSEMQQGAQQQLQQLQQRAQGAGDEAAAAARTAGAASAWGFFIYGLLTLAAAILGGRTGAPRVRHVVQEERVPPPGAPLPHRA